MDYRRIFFYFIFVFAVVGCVETSFIDDPNQKDEVIVRHHHTTSTSNSSYQTTTYETPSTTYTTTTSQSGLAQLTYEVQSDYPSGRATGIEVWSNGQLLTENALIAQGTYNVSIRKTGYETINKTVSVVRDIEGKYALTGMLRAKERLLIFQFTDERTGAKVTANKVSIAEVGGGSETQIISDQSYIKPGRKIIVIECSGYRTHTQEFDLPPSETSFILSANLTPKY